MNKNLCNPCSNKILVFSSYAKSLINFRGKLLLAMKRSGHEVTAVAPECDDNDEVRGYLAEIGVRFISINLSRSGINPLQDFLTYRCVRSVVYEIRPDILLAYTAKPVIYGGLAARYMGNIRFFPMITGLGYAFTKGVGVKRKLLSLLISRLYRYSLRYAGMVFFQNPDDEQLFRDVGILPKQVNSIVVNGSGVDLDAFSLEPIPKRHIFLMLSRLVVDKGVREYVQAARIVKQRFPQVEFRLGGGLDSNPAAIQADELQLWIDSGVINYLGDLKFVHSSLANCRYYVLPSYREGTPRSVLEAMAVGRPIITTDTPGCRETVADGDNGFLVPVKSVDALVQAMECFIKDPSLAEQMGQRSRQIAEEKYDVHKVNNVMLQEMGL